MKINIFLVIITIIILSCNEPSPINSESKDIKNGILVLNEGLYGQNNSSVSFINPEKNEIIDDIYFNFNSRKLGDTGNDIKIIGNKIFIVVDYSNKVEILEKSSFQSLGFIDFGSFSGPREIEILDSNTIFVTTALNNKVAEIDVQNMKIKDAVSAGNRPEGIVSFNDLIFVANSGFGNGNTISVYTYHPLKQIKNIDVFPNPRFLLKDEKYVFLICSGIYDALGLGCVYKIDPVNLKILDSAIIEGNPNKFCISRNKLLILSNKGLLQFDKNNLIFERIIINSDAINPSGNVIYSVSYNKSDNYLYLGNPKTFTQNGEVVKIDTNGTVVSKFKCGLNPGKIVFLNE